MMRCRMHFSTLISVFASPDSVFLDEVTEKGVTQVVITSKSKRTPRL